MKYLFHNRKNTKNHSKSSHDRLPESVVRETILRVYDLLVAIVVLLSLLAIVLPHSNHSIWGDLEIRADEIFSRGTLVIFGVLFFLIVLTQRVTIYARRQQVKYMDARRQNENTNEFLSTMSYNIRTPVNSILGLNTIIGRHNKNPEVENYVTQIQRAGENLLASMDEILDFSKIEQDSIEIEESVYDTSLLLMDCYYLMKDAAAKKQIELLIENDPNLPRALVGDEVRIRQIIVNILSNAIKYTTEGYVHMKVNFDLLGSDELHLNIQVEDTGIGIAPENLPHVFDAYARMDIYKIRNVEGTGLGMAITKRLVEHMGGRIMVSSELGVGTVFRVRIPQKITDHRPTGSFDFSRDIRPFKKNDWFFAPGVSALVVDDVEMNRKILAGMIEPSGIRVDVADSGEACLALTKEEKYDIILLDDRMPGMNGVTCFQKIRKQPGGKNAKTPVMMVTANTVRGAAEHYCGMGFAYYLPKPIREEDLIFSMGQLLRGKYLEN